MNGQPGMAYLEALFFLFMTTLNVFLNVFVLREVLLAELCMNTFIYAYDVMPADAYC